MALAPYTSNEEVRGVLGISVEEIPDETLNLGIYERNLKLALAGIGSSVLTDFATVNAIAASSRTALQQTFYDGVALYSPYVVALQLTTSLPLFTAKDISDGKASTSKFSESPFKQMALNVQNDHDRFEKNLATAYALFLGGSAARVLPPTLFKPATSGTDRVTGSARA